MNLINDAQRDAEMILAVRHRRQSGRTSWSWWFPRSVSSRRQEQSSRHRETRSRNQQVSRLLHRRQEPNRQRVSPLHYSTGAHDGFSCRLGVARSLAERSGGSQDIMGARSSSSRVRPSLLVLSCGSKLIPSTQIRFDEIHRSSGHYQCDLHRRQVITSPSTRDDRFSGSSEQQW